MSNGRIYSKRVEYDGYKFDSDMECQYYKELKALEYYNNVKDIRVHPSYTLQEEFITANGKKHKAITYEPDFVFYDVQEQRLRFVDVKGFATEEFLIKWKLFDKFLDNHGCKGCYLEVMKYSKTTGWVEFEKYKQVMKSKRSQLIEEKNYWKNIVKKQEHQKELEENRKKRELARLKELQAMPKKSKAQLERTRVLLEKYSDQLQDD